MAATLDDINETLSQIQLQNAQLLQINSARGKVETVGSAIIPYGSTGPILLNASYYYCLSIELIGGTSTNTNVYVTIVTEQTQNPVSLPLNSTKPNVIIKGPKVTSISTDSTLTTGQSIIVYFIGMDHPEQLEIL